jgi:tetrahydromethanopterin S-methyltransferase subunit A
MTAEIAQGERWPIIAGRYVVGDATRSVAVCTLASSDLVDDFEGHDEIAIAGRLYTLNLGLEKLVWNVIANPAIRFLLLCGNDVTGISQGVIKLHDDGVDEEHRIVGVDGYQPFVHNLSAEEILAFQRQVEIIDCIGVTEVTEILETVRALDMRTPDLASAGVRHVFPDPVPAVANRMGEITLDAFGMFLVGIDRASGTITLDHYSADRRYLGTVTGTSAEAICHTLVRERVLSELSHAAYLGREVAKAEEALRWGLQFEQDRALFLPGQGGNWAPFGPRAVRGG